MPHGLRKGQRAGANIKGSKRPNTYWLARANRMIRKDGKKGPLAPRTRVSPPKGSLPVLSGERKSRAILVSSKFTPELGKHILKAVRKGLHYDDAAALGGVTRSIVQRWLREGAQLLETCIDKDISNLPEGEQQLVKFTIDFEKACARLTNENLDVIRRQRGSWWQAAAWILERRFPEKWGKREKVTHEDTRPVSRIDAKVLIASTDGVKAIGGILQALADAQQPVRLGPSGDESRWLGTIRQSADVEVRTTPASPEQLPVGGGSRTDQEADDLNSPEAREVSSDL